MSKKILRGAANVMSNKILRDTAIVTDRQVSPSLPTDDGLLNNYDAIGQN